MLVWGLILGACNVNGDGLGGVEIDVQAPASDARVPEAAAMQPTDAAPVRPDTTPALPDALPVVPDMMTPVMMPPDTAPPLPPLRPLGDACLRDDQCASNACVRTEGASTGICCNRPCASPCGQCSKSGICRLKADGESCGGPSSCNASAPFDEISHVCENGSCIEHRQGCGGFRCYDSGNVQQLRGCWIDGCQVIGGYACPPGTVCKDKPSWQGCVPR
jgi:hypothetical protein